MNFQYRDLGHRSRGEIVEITLSGDAANVRLMDSSNFSKFRRNGSGKYYGGLAKKSPVTIPIPRSGHWYVTLDFGGRKGSTRWGVRVLPGLLKPIRQSMVPSMPSLPSLSQALPASAVRDIIAAESMVYDVFISHAWEDKEEVARPLAKALREEGLEVWYDEFALRIGDSLRRCIDKGLAASRFGLVVLSEHFFGKKWPNYELDGLVTKGGTDDQIILPVWHNVDKETVMAYSPSLADKVARSTADYSVEDIALEVAELIRDRKGLAA